LGITMRLSTGYSGRISSVSDQSTPNHLDSRNTSNFILDQFREIKERLVARPESADLILKRIVVQLGDQKLNQSIQHVEESFCLLHRSRVLSESSTLHTLTLRIFESYDRFHMEGLVQCKSGGNRVLL
jgi:hypothetical protein